MRNGFVSNSSSSSFVVIRKDFMDGKIFLSKQDEAKLKKFGFKKASCYYADQVDFDLFAQEKGEKVSKNYQLGYSVSCNQDDVIYFLVKNQISFEALCEYDHYHVIYKSGAKDFLRIQNYGHQASMSNWRTDKNYKSIFEKGMSGIMDWDTNPVEKVNVKKWLKQQEKWQIEFEKNEAKEMRKFAEKVKNEKE